MRRWAFVVRRDEDNHLRAAYGVSGYRPMLPAAVAKVLVRGFNAVACARHGHEFFLAREDGLMPCQYCGFRRPATVAELARRDEFMGRVYELRPDGQPSPYWRMFQGVP